MRIWFKTFGCRLNRAEALDLQAQCLARGAELVDDPSEADLMIVRGCSVTGRAQHESESLVAHLRQAYPMKRVVAMGCLPGAQPFALRGSEAEKPVPMLTARAYLKVQDGCGGTCTFCTVPRFRGKPASEPFGAVLARARRFIAAGYREIVVTGCNLSLYGSEGRGLPQLVSALAALDPGCRVRLGSVEPGAALSEVVRVMADTPNVCPYLHVPVQSGSDRMLEQMGRPYRIRDIDLLLAEMARRMPEAGLGCDLIAGFPGEGELDHRASIGLLTRHPFTAAHVFPYSERPGTPAAKLGGALPRALRSERAHELSALAQAKRRQLVRRQLGRELEIVVERRHRAAGWTGERYWFEALSSPTGPSLRRKRMRCRATALDGDILRGILL